MANPIDIFITDTAFKQLEKTIALISNIDKEMLKTAQTALELSKNISIKTPIGLQNNADSNAKILADFQKQSVAINDLSKKYNDLQKSIEKTKPTQIAFQKQLEFETKARQALDAQREKALKQIEREQELLLKTENLYNKVQNKINSMIPTYNNLQIKVNLGISLSSKEEAQLALLTNRLNKYQDALKATDANIGKHQREVGNYAKANSNLSNSFGQITRELPNFGQSFSVGVLSLTNNIGALQDSIKQVKAQNAELKLQGKDTVSLVSQIGTAVFSWNTALYLGIGLLSAYSKEISEFTSELFGASKAMKSLKLTQDEFGKLSISGAKDSQLEILELRKYLAVVSDKKISDIERNIALKQLRQQYPFYFRDLTDEQILLGQTTKAQTELNLALNKRKQVEKATESNVKNKQNLIDLEEEIRLQTIIFKNAIKPKVNLNTGLKSTDPLLIAFEEKKLNGLLKDRIEYQKALIGNHSLIIKLKGQTIALEYQEDKTKTKKEKKPPSQKIELDFDYLKAELDREKTQIEQRKAITSEGMNNEKLSFQERIKFREEFSRISIELIDKEFNSENQLNFKKAQDDKEKNDLALKNKDVSFAKHSENIDSINRDLTAKLDKTSIELSNKTRTLNFEDKAFFENIQNQKLAFARKTSDLIFASEKSKQLAIANNEKLTTQVRQRAFDEYVRLAKEELKIAMELELAKVPKDNKEQIDLIVQTYKNAAEEIDKIKSPELLKTEELEKQAKDFAQSFSKSFLGNAGLQSLNIFADLDINGKSTFENMLTNAKGFSEKFAVVMGAVGDVAKDVFALVRQSSQENFNAERAQLEEQYAISTAFAGDSAEAKKAIDKQYQDKQKEIKNREAKANKELALFNIAISTAQGVVSALAQPKPNIPLSIAIGIIGAIQLAAVASKEIPKYFKGGKHDGGLGMINDGVGTNYVETVKTPDGKFSQYSGRNLVLDMPKGTEILTPEQWQNYQMNELLKGTGILRAKVNFNENIAVTGFSDSQVNKIVEAVRNMPVSDLNFDNGKFQSHVKNGHQTKITLNTRVTFAGENV